MQAVAGEKEGQLVHNGRARRRGRGPAQQTVVRPADGPLRARRPEAALAAGQAPVDEGVQAVEEADQQRRCAQLQFGRDQLRLRDRPVGHEVREVEPEDGGGVVGLHAHLVDHVAEDELLVEGGIELQGPQGGQHLQKTEKDIVANINHFTKLHTKAGRKFLCGGGGG